MSFPLRARPLGVAVALAAHAALAQLPGPTSLGDLNRYSEDAELGVAGGRPGLVLVSHRTGSGVWQVMQTDGGAGGTFGWGSAAPGSTPSHFMPVGFGNVMFEHSPDAGLTLFWPGMREARSQLGPMPDPGEVRPFVLGNTLVFCAATGGKRSLHRLQVTDWKITSLATPCGPAVQLGDELFVLAPAGNTPAVLRTRGDGPHQVLVPEVLGNTLGVAVGRLLYSLPHATGGSGLYAAVPGGPAFQLLSTPESTTERLPRDFTSFRAGTTFWLGRDSLLFTDGTPAGTRMLGTFPQSEDGAPNRGGLFSTGTLTFFRTRSAKGGDALWRTDGTVAGTRQVYDWPDRAVFESAAGLDTALYFTRGGTLFRSNELNVEAQGLIDARVLGPLNAFEMLAAGRPHSGSRALYRFSAQGAAWVGPVNGRTLDSNPRALGSAKGALLFFAEDAHPLADAGVGLYFSDGNVVARAVTQKRFRTPEPLGALADRNWFLDENQLWVTDGTDRATVPLREGVKAAHFAIAGGVAWLSTHEGLLRLGAARETTSVVHPDWRGAMWPFQNELLGACGSGLCRWDAKGGAVIAVHPVKPRAGSGQAAPGYVLFQEEQTLSLWRSNGTAAGTFALTSPNPDPLAPKFRTFGNFGDVVYFLYPANGVGLELWTTDGTAANTRMWADLAPGEASLQVDSWQFFEARFVFTADIADAGRQLFRALDTPPRPLTPGTNVGPFLLSNVNGLFYAAGSEPFARLSRFGASDRFLPDGFGRLVDPLLLGTLPSGLTLVSAVSHEFGREPQSVVLGPPLPRTVTVATPPPRALPGCGCGSPGGALGLLGTLAWRLLPRRRRG